MEMSVDTNNDHVSSYADIRCLAYVASYSVFNYSGQVVLILLIMEAEEEIIGRQFNSFEELEPLA